MSNIITKIISWFLALFSFLPGCGVGQIRKAETDTVLKDTSDYYLNDTVEYAYNIKNSVQCTYSDTNRTAYKMTNDNMSFIHKLSSAEKTATLSDRNGKAYIKNSFKSFYTDKSGVKHYFENSLQKGKINTIRLGEYYYECHVRDFSKGNFYVDKAYHVYGDKMYMQYDILADKPTTDLKEFGSEIKIPLNTVKGIQIVDKNGTHYSEENIDAESVEYVAFDIIDTGVVGFIVPDNGTAKSLKVERNYNSFIVTQYAAYTPGEGINDYKEEGGYKLNRVSTGCRVYSDKTHSFEGIAKAAKEERNPLEVTVSAGNSNARYVGYDALRGCYTLTMDGVFFQLAYDNPEMQFNAVINVKGGSADRNIFIRSNGRNGCLEAGAILDDNGKLVPVEVEVCKNFCGDGGEPIYGYKDYEYGDTFFPLSIKAGKDTKIKLLNLYQNWGKSPLKQLSSIEFHVSYYHLSTGTTESNCIAPYGVYQKDGFVLPDFRNRSGEIWEGQPQFNSVGILKFMTHRENYVEKYNEFTGSIINSCGLTYSDVVNNYKDDNGNFTYSLRHIEMPQTDENRTYYTLDITFDKDVTYDNFKKDFDFFNFNGRFVKFKKTDFLNANNETVTVPVDTSNKDVYYTLGNNCPYFGFYDVTDDTKEQVEAHFGCNFALLVKDKKITVNGVQKDIPLVFRDFSTKNETNGALTLDAKKISFKKGDKITLDIILLPWGTGYEDKDKNVLTVREDSLVYPVKVTAVKGTVEKDTYLPVVVADNEMAKFTVTGGRNNIAITVKGFKGRECPPIYMALNGGNPEKIVLNSSNGYDGYDIKPCDDGMYKFSFVYNVKSPTDVAEFIVGERD